MTSLQNALPTTEETWFRQAVQCTTYLNPDHSTLKCTLRTHYPICHSHTIPSTLNSMNITYSTEIPRPFGRLNHKQPYPKQTPDQLLGTAIGHNPPTGIGTTTAIGRTTTIVITTTCVTMTIAAVTTMARTIAIVATKTMIGTMTTSATPTDGTHEITKGSTGHKMCATRSFG